MTPIYNSLKAPRQKKAGRKGGKKRKKKTHKIAVCTHTCEREKKTAEKPQARSLWQFSFSGKEVDRYA
jgi:hypothetical protein